MANIETSGNLQLRPFAKSSDRRLKIMVCRLNSQIIAAIGALLFMCSGSVAAAHPAEKAKPAVSAVLWTDPGDIRSLNLFWGPGGEKHQPQQPVEFLEEDMNGTSPKFDVRDAAGKKWKAKLGLEAKPETAASRFLWAVGYAANENYFVDHLQVTNMPPQLKRRRAHGLTGHDGDVPNVRLQRLADHDKRVGDWNWHNNLFYGSREFNGLRVMMGLIANWDLKDENNAILEDEIKSGARLYEVSDVGTAFGTPGKKYSDKASKGNVGAYCHTKLIAHIHKDYIDLNFPRRPSIANLFELEWDFFFHQVSIEWIGKHIPRSDAKWIGSLLAQLSPDQIRDAFRAAGYSPTEVDALTQAVISRIQELNSL
ncbi:MAG: hypothetical protein AUG89_03210 [Acidobacteria bacterium 13_1_20CM_4_56_7]|nr:MAG: hypothetical protein AUG89_03210 [Acidobacteria bacterium 13_1_20CM_4_56_7]